MTALAPGREVAPTLPDAGRVRSMLDFYGRTMRLAAARQFQYRASNYFYMVGMIAEPVIYLVVWSTIARSNGGQVSGYSPGAFAAYYIVWTLVRNMNIVFTPFGWEDRIQRGRFSGDLLRPMHPMHYDVAYFAGWKLVMIAYWLPIAAVLTLAFRPALHPSWQQVLAFVVAIWLAYLIRTVFFWALGLVTLWTTRVAALFDLVFTAELLLSGRLVPMALMPQWVQDVARFLPFQSTFGFPITALVGPVDGRGLVLGLLEQVLWVALGTLIVAVVWKRAVRRYSAVGN